MDCINSNSHESNSKTHIYFRNTGFDKILKGWLKQLSISFDKALECKNVLMCISFLPTHSNF